MSKLKTKIKRFNDWIAINVTKIFGTMWLTYIFFIFGFVPVFCPETETWCLYWSNTIQLWALPLLMVGTNLLDKFSERRAQKQYQMIKEELDILKELLDRKRSGDV